MKPEDISWKPLKKGGSNFATHKSRTSEGKLIFKARGRSKLILFLVTSILTIVSIILYLEQKNSVFILVMAFAVLVALIGWINLRRKLLFDKTTGYFWKGMSDRHPNSSAIPLKDVIALQFLEEAVKTTTNDSRVVEYKSYEMNLVLKNGERVNVLDHGNSKDLKASDNAVEISTFLNVPVWTTSDL